MAGFGGAVKLTGESEYRKALSKITQDLREISSEMKVVTSQYDKNDNSTQKLAQQEEVLNKQLDAQKEKLSTLEKQYSSMSAKVSDQADKHSKLGSDLESAKAKMEDIARVAGKDSEEYKAQAESVKTLESALRKSETAQTANENSMSRLRVQINNAQADCNKTANALDKLGREAQETDSQIANSSQGYTVMKGTMANLASQGITTLIRGLAKLGAKAVEVGKEALGSYSDYEQLVGGVDTIFKSSSKTVQKYAQNAYKTAGMSANEYMDTVTSFSASLLQGLGGDTKKASKYADQAIRDMSDNANKMGTDITSIQNAYQGFAKGNMSMLDNLKLGYGGTQKEMFRLMSDAQKMDSSFKAVFKLDSKGHLEANFHDMAQAIHIVQQNMGITGTTAKEAEQTIEGSTKAMKASWQNLLTGIAGGGGNFKETINEFSQTFQTFLGNIIPRITDIVGGLGQTLSSLLPQLLTQIGTMISDNLPLLLKSLTDALPLVFSAGESILNGIIDGIIQGLPILAEQLPVILDKVVTSITEGLPKLIDGVMSLIENLAQALPSIAITLIEKIPDIITGVLTALVNSTPRILQGGIRAFTALVNALPVIIQKLSEAIPKVVESIVGMLEDPKQLGMLMRAGFDLFIGLAKAVPLILASLVQAFVNLFKATFEIIGKMKWFEKFKEIGINLIKGIGQGVLSAKDWLFDKIKGVMTGVTDKVKSFLGIHSPSKLYEDEIGDNMALGIGKGFVNTMKGVTKEIENAIPTNIDVNTTLGNQDKDTNFIKDMQEAMSGMAIELDDQKVGAFVTQTVTDAIYT